MNSEQMNGTKVAATAKANGAGKCIPVTFSANLHGVSCCIQPKPMPLFDLIVWMFS